MSPARNRAGSHSPLCGFLVIHLLVSKRLLPLALPANARVDQASGDSAADEQIYEKCHEILLSFPCRSRYSLLVFHPVRYIIAEKQPVTPYIGHVTLHPLRSEERRVGKECRYR